ncbi:MAG: hypothetical protein IH905_08780 [Proteobacteria bacterium]|nr:hypothetical protein [Pseudomonadota bacterium]
MVEKRLGSSRVSGEEKIKGQGLPRLCKSRCVAGRVRRLVHIHLGPRARQLTRRLAQPPSLQHVFKSLERAQGILSTPVKSELVERKVERKIFDKLGAELMPPRVIKGTCQQYELTVLIEIHQRYGVFLNARSLEY